MSRVSRPFLVVGLVAAGIAYRFLYVLDQVGKLNGDDATVALMARHILAGHHYAFFWGQDYMGTFEAYSIAAAAALFGLDDVVLRSVPLFYGTLYVLALWMFAHLLFDARVGWVTLALAALPPPLLAVWSSAPRGGYTETLFLGQTILVLAVLLARHRPASWGLLPATLLGLLSGLALWTSFLSVPFLVVAAAILWIRDLRAPLRRTAVFALAGFATGSLPFWIANIRHEFASFRVFTAGSDVSLRENLRNVGLTQLPQTLGVRDLVGAEAMLLPPLGHVAMAILVSLTLAGAWFGLRRLGRDWFRGDLSPGGEVCVFLGITLFAIYVPTRYASWHTDRFLLPLYGAVLPLIAAGWVSLARRSRLAAIGVIAVVLPVWTCGAWNLHRALVRRETDQERFGPLLEALRDAGVRQGTAPHEIAMVVTYRSNEQVILRDPWRRRYPVGELAAWSPEAFVATGRVPAWRDTLNDLGFDFTFRAVDRKAIFHGLHPRTPPGRLIAAKGWHARANTAHSSPSRAFDGAISTRWGSGTPQRPGLSFEIDLGRVHELVGVRLDAGTFFTDWPRGLRVEASPDGASWQQLRAIESPLPGLVRVNGTARLTRAAAVEAWFPPTDARFVRFVQTGHHRIYDWSIAELSLYERIDSSRHDS